MLVRIRFRRQRRGRAVARHGHPAAAPVLVWGRERRQALQRHQATACGPGCRRHQLLRPAGGVGHCHRAPDGLQAVGPEGRAEGAAACCGVLGRI
eukprot:6736962-Pyramimonas_sp.AAC.1